MKFLSRAQIIGTTLPLLFISPIVFAETTSYLDEVVVSANRVARTVDETLVPVTVITREDIEKYQASDITDVLRKIPGLSITNRGGLGKSTSVYLRGTNTSHALVLVDGVKIGSATLGSIAFEHLPISNIERIEVVRGPRSSLYGSEAIGGVIQIFTRKKAKGFQPQLTISAGSHNTKEATANFAGGNGNTWYNLNIGSLSSNGIDSRLEAFGAPDTETDNDGYRREHASLTLGRRFSANTEAEIQLQNVQGNNEFDSGNNDSSKFEQQVISANLKTSLNDKTDLLLRIGQSKDETDNFQSGNFFSRFNTKRDSSTLKLNTDIGESGILAGGIDWQKDHIDTSSNYAKDSRKNTGVFISYQNKIGKTDFEVSARQDDNEAFGKKNTGSISAGYTTNNNIRLTASHGTAFKAPTFNDLYYPADMFGVGNPDVQPESSRNTEIGLQKHWDNTSLEINLYKNKIDNLIEWAPIPGSIQWTPSNVAKAEIKGLEISTGTKINQWDINANASFLRTKNLSATNTNNKLIYRPETTLNLNIDRDFGRWSAGGSFHAETARFTNAANTQTLDGFRTLDLRAAYDINKDWSLGVKVNNLLDAEYETDNGYNQDGINGMMTLKYSPK